MAAYVKFHKFIEDLGKKIHDLHADTLRVYLTNATPDQTADLIKTDLAEIAAGNGYPAGGNDIQNTYTQTAGVGTVNAVDSVFLAAGGSIGPLTHAVCFNDTPAAPLDPLISSWAYGSALTLLDGESLTIDHGANSLLTLQ